MLLFTGTKARETKYQLVYLIKLFLVPSRVPALFVLKDGKQLLNLVSSKNVYFGKH